MAKRLHKYNFKSLPKVKPEANQWLRENAMDCIAWAQYIVGDNPSSEITAPALHKEGLSEEELKNILSVSLVEERREDKTSFWKSLACPIRERDGRREQANSQYHANTAQSSGSYCDDNDEECGLAAPKTPTYIPHHDVEAICPPSPGIAHNPPAVKSAKRPHVQSQAYSSKKQMTLTGFMPTGTQP
ncbi:hypothetical protein ACROYT_G013885 [Oculina patagonica]